MALTKSLILALLGGAIAFSALAQQNGQSDDDSYDDRVVEEVIVSARGWRKSEPEDIELPEAPRWQISDETREKMTSRMQFGYDPVVEEIRNTDNRIKVRGNMREPEPVTIFRASF